MKEILDQYTPDQVSRAKAIRALVMDVDGVMTDGGIIYDNDFVEYKRFNVKDGQIISHLKRSGIIVGVLTGRDSEVVKKRCEELKMDFHYHGLKDKLAQLHEVQATYQLAAHEIAYIGDDIIDLDIMRQCGLACAPADALSYVRREAHLVTQVKGGEGAVREVADLILSAQNKFIDIIKTKDI